MAETNPVARVTREAYVYLPTRFAEHTIRIPYLALIEIVGHW